MEEDHAADVPTHSTGFNNFWFMEPDFKLHIHFDPGTRFSYSGEGIVLLQFVIEHGRTSQGLGVDVGDLMDANFKRLGMTRTSVVFRPDLASDLADGWNDQGKVVEHNRSGRVRAAGSMDTTISDFSKFAAPRTSEAAFAQLVKFLLGETGVPYDWEYGDYAGKS